MPADIRAKYGSIPWSRIAGIGNILRHEYRSVSPDVVWRVTRENLPELKAACLTIRKELKRSKRA